MEAAGVVRGASEMSQGSLGEGARRRSIDRLWVGVADVGRARVLRGTGGRCGPIVVAARAFHATDKQP